MRPCTTVQILNIIYLMRIYYLSGDGCAVLFDFRIFVRQQRKIIPNLILLSTHHPYVFRISSIVSGSIFFILYKNLPSLPGKTFHFESLNEMDFCRGLTVSGNKSSPPKLANIVGDWRTLTLATKMMIQEWQITFVDNLTVFHIKTLPLCVNISNMMMWRIFSYWTFFIFVIGTFQIKC